MAKTEYRYAEKHYLCNKAAKKPYTYTRAEIEKNRRLLELLSQKFPTIQSASTEIINLEAILNLPKGTEHFVADIHGEYEAFRHILKNGILKVLVEKKILDLLILELHLLLKQIMHLFYMDYTI